MSLTYGTGPLGDKPLGSFNRDLPREELVYLEAYPRWIRARKGGETVVDSKQPKLIHRHTQLPKLLFPREHVRTDLLPDEALTEVEGLLQVEWDAADEWLEEDEPLMGHMQDPYHRLDTRPTSRHVRISVNGETVAETVNAHVLFESAHPPRWYIPEEDVRMELLEPSDKTSVCAYKGIATYWSVGEEEDIVWTYRDPLKDGVEVKDKLCFFNERVDIELDGEPEERPRTQWSRD